MRGLVLWALAGPVLFLVAIVAASGVFGVLGTAPEAIPGAVQGQASVLLLATLALLGLGARRLPRVWGGRGVGVGAALGLALALAYLGALAPLLARAQEWGDYVPPGSVLQTVSGQPWAFALANVLLAPWVEEVIYRGHLLGGFKARFGGAWALALSCLAFGLLHWTGGLWYMLLTGVVAGGLFGALALRTGGLAAPYAAHLTLNLVETLWTFIFR